MKFCKFCGAKLDDTSRFCAYCGNPADDSVSSDASVFGDEAFGDHVAAERDFTPSRLVAVLSFIFWWLGLIFILCYREKKPGRSESAIKGTLGGVCFGIPLLGLVLYLLWKTEYPERARVIGISAIAGVAFNVVTFILSFTATLAAVMLG